MFAVVEAGGTKFVCAIVDRAGAVLAETRFPTTDPERTIARAVAFIDSALAGGHAIEAIGIGAFGPVTIDRSSSDFGRIGETPKRAWRGTDMVAPFERFGVPVGLDTDVNAAALGEYAALGNDGATLLYLTVGTGIGGGLVIAGQPIHGLAHPEMGHMHVPVHHDLEPDGFAGVCPTHGVCLEGLAAGPAIAARWGTPAQDLPPDHPAWQLEALYLAYGLVNLIRVCSPTHVILGGGVMEAPGLLDGVRARVSEIDAGYASRLPEIRTPRLAHHAGIRGAAVLARSTLEERSGASRESGARVSTAQTGAGNASSGSS